MSLGHAGDATRPLWPHTASLGPSRPLATTTSTEQAETILDDPATGGPGWGGEGVRLGGNLGHLGWFGLLDRGRVVVASGRERPSEAVCGRRGRVASPTCPRDTVGTSRAGESGPIGRWGSLSRPTFFLF